MDSASIADLLQDRDNDGIPDYLNARIFVPADPSPPELAAACNVAARLAFEVLSLDLPLAGPVSAYDPRDPRIPIFIGRAAETIVADPRALMLPVDEAERFARNHALLRYSAGLQDNPMPQPADSPSLDTLYGRCHTLVLRRDVKCIAVVDLAARLALESTWLKLPLAMAEQGELPDGSIVIGRLEESHNAGEARKPSQPGRGWIQQLEEPSGKTLVVISGDDDGEAAAIRYAAYGLPYVSGYRRSSSLEMVRAALRRDLTRQTATMDNLIFDNAGDLSWEVDTALRKIEEIVLPFIGYGSSVRLELRLSEPPATRVQLASRIFESLVDNGADPALSEVTVLSAYKQGYSWIHEVLVPQLKEAHSIRIRFRNHRPDENAVDSPLRWLQELYPIDEVLSRELHIPLDRITFESLPEDAPFIYEVTFEDASGREWNAGTFNPACVKQSLFQLFPDYANALVTTGWLHASVGGIVVADERIETDPERFWDWYQKEVLAPLAGHLIALYNGKIDPRCAPHFGTLEIEVSLSEPDFKIGIDEERISSLEALHEDIYFETLLFLDVLGETHCGRRLTYPGRIIPRVTMSQNGLGSARARLTGKLEPGAPRPTLETPAITRVEVEAGASGLLAVDFRVAADSSNLEYTDIAFPGIRSVSLHFADRGIDLTASAALSDEAEPAAPAGVQWNTPIGPVELERVLAQLRRFPEVSCYRAGMSYLGHPVWVLEVRHANTGEYFSVAKASLEKAVLLITGRQHANEVSSTSHILRLAEMLVSDAEIKKLLERVIFVLHPITNPDGAALLEELRPLIPGLMLHACYLGALGMDVSDRCPEENPIYPEAEVRRLLIRRWKPDLVLNPHGYPSHEWVQMFAGYSAWVRSRARIARDWWIPRGWFIPHLEYTATQKKRVLELLDHLSRELEPATSALNSRMRARYRKYGEFDPQTYRMSSHRDLLVNLKENNGLPADAPLEIVTEVPDEVAEGSWLYSMAQIGLECSLAVARFMANRQRPVTRLYLKSEEHTILEIRGVPPDPIS